jgi:gas vesicle protein
VNTAGLVAVSSVLAALLTFLGVRYSARASVQVAQTPVDAQAYARAVEIWEKALANLDKQVGELKADLTAEKQDSRKREDRLEQRIEQLETAISALGHPVPAWPTTGNR